MLLWLSLMVFYSKDSYIYSTGFSIFRKSNIWRQIGIDIYRYLVGAVGIIAVTWSLKNLYTFIALHENSWMTFCRKKIEYMGRNSIIYYVLSTYLFAWIVPEITKKFTFNFALTLIETAIVTLLCDIVGRLIRHFRRISKWLIAT